MQNKILICGEAWGEQEDLQRAPFVGPSGYLLTKMLEEAGIVRADCYLTNVFNLRPRGNDIESLCVSKTDDRLGLPPLRSGKYLSDTYAGELTRLSDEVQYVRPNVVIACGGTASWAFLHNTAISKLRGTVAFSPTHRVKVLPVFHPAAILRDWSLRHVTVLDLQKARRESEFPEIRRPERTVYIEPSLADMEWYYENFLVSASQIAVDIETAGDQITCIGFAPDPRSALVVPFNDPRRAGSSYWASAQEERLAWGYVSKVLLLPRARKIFQNGLYDINFLWRAVGLTCGGDIEDTMLMHHSLHPESQKGLGFLGSVYSNEASWKLNLRSRGKKETIKRED